MQKKILTISLIWALLGLFILSLISIFLPTPQIKISDLDENIGRTVLVSAEVTGISYSKNAVFVDLADETGNVTGVFFGTFENSVIRGDKVAVKGKVQLYNGDTELVIQELVCLICQ